MNAFAALLLSAKQGLLCFIFKRWLACPSPEITWVTFFRTLQENTSHNAPKYPSQRNPRELPRGQDRFFFDESTAGCCFRDLKAFSLASCLLLRTVKLIRHDGWVVYLERFSGLPRVFVFRLKLVPNEK